MRILITLTSGEISQINKIAKARFENAKKTSKQYTYGNKPAPKTHKRDVLGLSGEWVIKKYLNQLKSNLINLNIIDDTTEDVVSKKSKDDYYDFLIEIENEIVSIEVKTTTCLHHAHLLIPKHRRKTKSDYYCLVKKLSNEVYEISGFAHKDKVFKVLDKTRASPCYSMHEDLLYSFQETVLRREK